jgi:hypothetical protein
MRAVRWRSRCRAIGRGTVEPQLVTKRQRRLTDVDEVVLSLYAHGLTTGEISAHFADVYTPRVRRQQGTPKEVSPATGYPPTGDGRSQIKVSGKPGGSLSLSTRQCRVSEEGSGHRPALLGAAAAGRRARAAVIVVVLVVKPDCPAMVIERQRRLLAVNSEKHRCVGATVFAGAQSKRRHAGRIRPMLTAVLTGKLEKRSDLRFFGGAKGTRTPDPHTASVVRYQLRHSPEKSCSSKLHHWPHAFKVAVERRAIAGAIEFADGLPPPRRCWCDGCGNVA